MLLFKVFYGLHAFIERRQSKRGLKLEASHVNPLYAFTERTRRQTRIGTGGSPDVFVVRIRREAPRRTRIKKRSLQFGPELVHGRIAFARATELSQAQH